MIKHAGAMPQTIDQGAEAVLGFGNAGSLHLAKIAFSIERSKAIAMQFQLHMTALGLAGASGQPDLGGRTLGE